MVMIQLNTEVEEAEAADVEALRLSVRIFMCFSRINFKLIYTKISY